MGDHPSMSDEEQLRLALLADLGLRAAALVHELRQPLFAIQGLAQLGVGQGDADERLRAIAERASFAAQLLEAHRGLGAGVSPAEVHDLNDPVRTTVLSFCSRSQVSLDLDLASTRLPVRWRRLAARQVVHNLLQNAVQAAAGSREPRVRIRTWEETKTVHLEVLDSGPGVAAEVLEKLGQPFTTTKSPEEGTGLGLFIVKHLIAEAAGEFALLPSDEGTRARVVLPKVA